MATEMSTQQQFDDKQPQRCSVCNMPDAARHYNGVCCPGCKSFFLRSIRYKRRYECALGNCNVMGQNRNACRGCRLQKCLAAGLDPTLVTEGRSRDEIPPDDPQNVVESTSAASSYALVPTGADGYASCQYYDYGMSKFGYYPVGCTDQASIMAVDAFRNEHALLAKYQRVNQPSCLPLGARLLIPALVNPRDMDEVKGFYLRVDELLDAYCEHGFNHAFASRDQHHYNMNANVYEVLFQPRLLSDRSKLDWTPQYTMPMSIGSIYARISTNFIDWASHVYEMSLLDESDRLHLLAGRGTQWIWLNCAQKTYSYGRRMRRQDPLFLVGGACYLSFAEEPQVFEPSEMFRQFQSCPKWAYDEIVVSARELVLTDDEFNLLKLLCFTTPVREMSKKAREILTQAQHFYRSALIREAMRHENGNFETAMNRLARMLSYLTVVETCARIEDDSVATMSTFDVADMGGTFTHEFHVIRKYR